jgi:hypothetical protein
VANDALVAKEDVVANDALVTNEAVTALRAQLDVPKRLAVTPCVAVILPVTIKDPVIV